MIPAISSRRGMTLAELLVTLALVVIMIAMAVSFVMMMSGQTKASENNLAFQQDFSMVKSVVEGWMTKTVGQTVTATESAVTAGDGGVLQFSNGTLTAGTDVHIRLVNVESVRFALEKKGGDYLLFCTVYRAGSGESYIFCVNPRVGETVGAG